MADLGDRKVVEVDAALEEVDAVVSEVDVEDLVETETETKTQNVTKRGENEENGGNEEIEAASVRKDEVLAVDLVANGNMNGIVEATRRTPFF